MDVESKHFLSLGESTCEPILASWNSGVRNHLPPRIVSDPTIQEQFRTLKPMDHHLGVDWLHRYHFLIILHPQISHCMFGYQTIISVDPCKMPASLDIYSHKCPITSWFYSHSWPKNIKYLTVLHIDYPYPIIWLVNHHPLVHAESWIPEKKYPIFGLSVHFTISTRWCPPSYKLFYHPHKL